MHLKLCYSKIVVNTSGWDSEVIGDLKNEWEELSSETQCLTSLLFPRRYSSLTNGKHELHVFSDATDRAMGACVYLRTVQEGICESTLMVGKSRLFPLTQIYKFSIARKELLALCMGTDLLQQCKMYLTLTVSEIHIWVDSMTVIKWCQCTAKQLKQFVRNRVDKVMRVSDGNFPKYVSTKENPADIASRGIKPKQYGKIDLWTNGPSFLRHPNKERNLSAEVTEPILCNKDVEVEMNNFFVSHSNVIQVEKPSLILEFLSNSESCLEAERRLMLIIKCFQALGGDSKRFRKPESDNVVRANAKLVLLKLAQFETMGDLTTIMRDKHITFEESVMKLPRKERPQYLVQLFKFVPFLAEDGLLRIGGRFQNSDMASNFKHPILLPYRHWLTELYVKKTHCDLGHFGSDMVFGVLQLDCGLWPVGGVCTVRFYIRNCLGCKLRRRKRGEQLMAPLPVARFQPRSHVFTYAASDLTGPFSVVVGRSTVKRWLCVFVCMVTTTVRVEVAADLSASTFVNVFRRFLCSTGFKTRFMRTDNGTNYVGGNNISKKELKAALSNIADSNTLNDQMQKWEIHWEFGPPKASHHGGIYERQIRTMKQALRGFSEVLTKSPTDDEFLTCAKMAEYVMNCRPITKSQSADGLPPLRPIDLMVGALDPTFYCAYPYCSTPHDMLRRGHRYTQRIVELWWDQWFKLYLHTLQRHQKWRNVNRDFLVGDLILLCDEKAPRFLKYPFAVITKVNQGTDGHVRSVVARMSDGRVRERDITKIALIDSADNDNI